MVRFSDRPSGEILLFMIAATVCAIVLIGAIAVLVAEIVHPEADTSGAASTIGDSLAALIALLAGFLAGRSSSPGQSEDTVHTTTEETP